MDVLVYGAGAVGGYLGGRLSQAGHNVTLVTRPIAADFINSSGLAVTEEEKRILVRPRAVSTLRQAFLDDAAYDLILLTMKSYDVETAINEMVAFCPSPPPLVTLQNGIGVEEMFRKQFGPGLVIAGSLTVPLSQDSSHSIIVEKSGRGLAMAPTEKGQSIKQWLEVLRAAGVHTVAVGNYQAMKWSKVFLNIIGNASSAILNRHPRVIYSFRPTFEMEISMLKETLAVMKRLKLPLIDLPGSPANRLVTAMRWLPHFLLQPIVSNLVGSGRGSKMPSFHVDLASGKSQSEVLYHNGAIVKAGLEHSVPTPVNATLTDLLLKLARKEIDWQEYDGNPKRLVAEVKKYQPP